MTDWRSSTGIALYTLDHIQVMLQQTSGTAPSVAITQADEGKIATAHNFTRGMGCSEEPDMVGMRPYMMTERCKGSIDVLSRVFRDAPSSQPLTPDRVPDVSFWLNDEARLNSLEQDLADMPMPSQQTGCSWWQTVSAFNIGVDLSNA
jgi:hypothetical protein